MERAWPLLLNLAHQLGHIPIEVTVCIVLAVGIFAGQALKRNQVLDQAAILIRARVLLQELLPCLQLVSQSTDDVRSIDRAVNFASITDHSQKLVSKRLLRLG